MGQSGPVMGTEIHMNIDFLDPGLATLIRDLALAGGRRDVGQRVLMLK